MKFFKTMLMIFLFLFPIAVSAEEIFTYEPVKVVLHGYITLEQRYGPPNYGEDPQTDERVTIFILNLDSPIDVVSQHLNSLDRDSFFGVKRIQLTSLPGLQLDNFVGEHVLVYGNLFQRENGNHYTNVLMFVDKVSPPDSME